MLRPRRCSSGSTADRGAVGSPSGAVSAPEAVGSVTAHRETVSPAIVIDGVRNFDEMALTAIDAADSVLLVVTRCVHFRSWRQASRCRLPHCRSRLPRYRSQPVIRIARQRLHLGDIFLASGPAQLCLACIEEFSCVFTAVIISPCHCQTCSSENLT